MMISPLGSVKMTAIVVAAIKSVVKVMDPMPNALNA